LSDDPVDDHTKSSNLASRHRTSHKRNMPCNSKEACFLISFGEGSTGTHAAGEAQHTGSPSFSATRELGRHRMARLSG
jgi:hypothetical protein